MKLRVKHNSVRVRLNRTEVAHLIAHHSLDERIDFSGDGSNAFVYVLRLDESATNMLVAFQCGLMTITLPLTHARLWATDSDKVGLCLEKDIGYGKSLGITVEKDFQCVDGPPEEIDPQAYPNPLLRGCSVASSEAAL